jgi:hypothetical protein
MAPLLLIIMDFTYTRRKYITLHIERIVSGNPRPEAADFLIAFGFCVTRLQNVRARF